MSNEHILIVDDESSIRTAIRSVLSEEGYSVSEARCGEEALELISKETPDVVLLDIWLPGLDGLDVLKKMKEVNFPGFILVMSGHGTIETAVKATKLGAYDFIEKPLSLDKLLLVIKNLLSVRELKEENKVLRQKIKSQFEMVFRGIAMQKLVEQIHIAAPTNSWILITGENGTGKELVARSIHKASLRKEKPFIEVNCAAIPEELIESELFGHEKGAFTGATASRRGKFDLADGTTLFLDEIGDMSLKTQAKVLRILQEQKFERVGGSKTIQVEVRVLAATNKDLEQEIENGTFRADLYYRLNVVPIQVPPLRERREDIPLLVADFVADNARKGLGEKEFSPGALQAMMQHGWPGNVRELRNFVERVMIMCPAETVDETKVGQLLGIAPADAASLAVGLEELYHSLSYKEAKKIFERDFLKARLAGNDGNISQTAEQIGLERSHLHRKMKSLSLDED